MPGGIIKSPGDPGETTVPDMAYWGLTAVQVSGGSGYSSMASLDELGTQMTAEPPNLQDWEPPEDS